MKKIALVLLIGAAAAGANARCFGTGNFQTCTDDSGNTYNVQRYGNTTHMQGYGANGSTWNQTSQTYGNTTYHNGTAANGNPWSGSTMNLPGMQIHQGTDSRGNPYSTTCTRWGGCN